MRRSRKVKILATLGPASADDATLNGLIAAGVDVFRINLSHGLIAEQPDPPSRRGPVRRSQAAD
jgi:pyruvate kinase